MAMSRKDYEALVQWAGQNNLNEVQFSSLVAHLEGTYGNFNSAKFRNRYEYHRNRYLGRTPRVVSTDGETNE